MCSGRWGGSSGASAATAEATTTRGDLLAEGGRGGLPRDSMPAGSAVYHNSKSGRLCHPGDASLGTLRHQSGDTETEVMLVKF